MKVIEGRGVVMSNLSARAIHAPCFVRLLIALNRWENSDQNMLRTASARELFYSIAECLLDEAKTPQYQTLKFFNGRFTDRAMRLRVREFEALGLVTTIPNPADARTKKLIPTREFVSQLNQQVRLQRLVCEPHMHLIDKS
jgi:hypothetical protein